MRTLGLLVSIHGTDCTNHGATSGKRDAVLIGDGIPEIFSPTEDAPELRLEYDLEPKGVRAGQLCVANPAWLRELGKLPKGNGSPYECLTDDWTSKHQIVRCRAVDPKGNGSSMFGGNYISTSDSRMPVTSPIPVHDRYE